MKRFILLLSFFGFACNIRSQVYNAGTHLSTYVDIDPDTVMRWTYFPYTTQIYHLNVFGNSTIEFLAKGSSSSGGSIALINVKPLDPHLFLSLGRLDSIYDSTSTNWLVTKVAKPLLNGEPVNDPGANWDNTLQYLLDNSASFGWMKSVNDFIGDDKYIGMKYINGNTKGYGWIRVKCIDKDSCFIKDVSYNMFTASLKELDNDKMAIFPNPVQTKFTVSIDPFLKVEELCVYNVLGACVWRNKTKALDQIIDLTTQPNGIYFLNLKTLNGFITKKIVKE